MTDQLLHDEPYGALWLAPDVPCVIIQWKSFANSRQFQFLMDRGLGLYREQAVRQTGPLGWLADTRQLSALTNADQAWLKQDWNARAYAAGIRQVSFMLADNVFGKMAVQNYSVNTQESDDYSIQTAHFQIDAEARQWLREALARLATGPAGRGSQTTLATAH